MRVAMTPAAMALARSGTVKVAEPEHHPAHSQHGQQHPHVHHTGFGLGGMGLSGGAPHHPDERR